MTAKRELAFLLKQFPTAKYLLWRALLEKTRRAADVRQSAPPLVKEYYDCDGFEWNGAEWKALCPKPTAPRESKSDPPHPQPKQGE